MIQRKDKLVGVFVGVAITGAAGLFLFANRYTDCRPDADMTLAELSSGQYRYRSRNDNWLVVRGIRGNEAKVENLLDMTPDSIPSHVDITADFCGPNGEFTLLVRDTRLFRKGGEVHWFAERPDEFERETFYSQDLTPPPGYSCSFVEPFQGPTLGGETPPEN